VIGAGKASRVEGDRGGAYLRGGTIYQRPLVVQLRLGDSQTEVQLGPKDGPAEK
jgi:hypothetical protein